MNSVDDQDIVKKLQSAQLEILFELDRVCKLLNITYCLAFGTALGAVRHKGFIPWDDDIDVYMRVEDLEILQNHTELFKKKFFLQHSGSDSQFGLMITRLRNSETTLIESAEVERDINHGIFIDIYPLFSSPERGMGARKLLIASMVYRLMLYGVVPKNRGLVMKLGSSFLLTVVPARTKKRLLQKCYKKMTSYSQTGFLSSLYGDEANIRYPEEMLFPVKWVPFEDVQLPIPSDADSYLTLTYGDYMQLPPEEKRTFHHGYECVDFDRPYSYYRGKLYCKESTK